MLVVAGLVVLVAVAGLSAYLIFTQPGGCGSTTADSVARYQAQKVHFGGVTEYCLANPTRWANGVVVGPDGSVWFGEQALPGFGRLFENGTVVEYQWPGAASRTITSYQTGIWGLTVWDGKVWGADMDGNRLVGVDPSTGAMQVVNASQTKFPYIPTVAPDGSLWYTALSTPARLGRVGTDLGLSVIPVEGLGKEEPIQIAFVNSSYAYLVALNPQSSRGEGGLYAFDPRGTNGTMEAVRIGGNFSLFFPDGVSYSGGQVWVAQHLPSNLLRYDVSSGEWTVFPTSTVSYESSTLPYFVIAQGAKVWFNEHYANRIALLDASAGTLTELSEANPPVTAGKDIQNDLTIAATPSGLWFTSTTGNYIGFVDGGYSPNFAISAQSNRLSLPTGGTATAQLEVTGTWSGPLAVQVSDSESSTSVPSLISIVPDKSSVAAGSGPVSLSVVLTAKAGLSPGRYTVAVTVGNGLEFQTAYLFVTVA